MPPEPQSKIEALLKAWARRRREQAGSFELHPLTRRQLQNAVLRKQQKPARRSWWTVPEFWPRLLAGCALVIVLVVAILVHQRPARVELASETAVKTPELARNVEQPKIAPSAPSGNLAEKRVAASPQSSSSTASKSISTLSAAPVPAPAATPPPAPGAPPPAAFASLKQAASTRLAFQRTDLAAQKDAKASAPDILSSFTVERNGQKVRVTDSDNSVYEGEIISQPADAISSRKLKGAASSTAESIPYGFRVAGPSKRLHQTVVFTGTIANLNSIAERAKSTVQADRSMAIGGALDLQPNQPLQVTGQVLIANQKAISIQAQSRPATNP